MESSFERYSLASHQTPREYHLQDDIPCWGFAENHKNISHEQLLFLFLVLFWKLTKPSSNAIKQPICMGEINDRGSDHLEINELTLKFASISAFVRT
jgi:hypothetical protein